MTEAAALFPTAPTHLPTTHPILLLDTYTSMPDQSPTLVVSSLPPAEMCPCLLLAPSHLAQPYV
jgi:hypothetical protein